MAVQPCVELIPIKKKLIVFIIFLLTRFTPHSTVQLLQRIQLQEKEDVKKKLIVFVIFLLTRFTPHSTDQLLQNIQLQCLYWSIDRYGPDPGSQATFYGGVTRLPFLIWPICFSKSLSALDV